MTDENGKRRFHGAFTGGFSAGYWNTVGSRDGWTPAQFKSSRADKKDGESFNVVLAWTSIALDVTPHTLMHVFREASETRGLYGRGGHGRFRFRASRFEGERPEVNMDHY